MKKRVLALTLALAVTAGLGACGSAKETQTAQTPVESEAAGAESEPVEAADASVTEETDSTEEVEVVHYEYDTPASSTFEIHASELVTELADYAAVPVEISAACEVNEENENSALLSVLSSSYMSTYSEVTDRDTIEEGDIVKLDYKGMKDGVAFDGGTAEDQMIDVYNNRSASGTGFIDGFTDALKGAKVGTTVEGNCTFPENYQSEELAGQEVVFEFNIKGIYKTTTLADLTDEDVASGIGAVYGFTTVDDLKAAIDNLLESNAYNAKVDAISDYMLENSTVEVPEDYLEARLNEYVAAIADRYCSTTQTLEEYFSENGYELETMKSEWREQLKSSIANELIFQVIAEKEGVELAEEEIAERVASIVSYYGYESEDALYEEYGYGNAEDGRKYIETQLVGSKAMDQLIQTAVVSYK